MRNVLLPKEKKKNSYTIKEGLSLLGFLFIPIGHGKIYKNLLAPLPPKKLKKKKNFRYSRYIYKAISYTPHHLHTQSKKIIPFLPTKKKSPLFLPDEHKTLHPILTQNR